MIENYELLRLSVALFLGVAMGILIVRNTEKQKPDNSFKKEILEAIQENRTDLEEARIERVGFIQELDKLSGKMNIIDAERRKAEKETVQAEESKRKQKEEKNSIERKIDSLKNS